VDFGSRDTRVFLAGRTPVVMPVNVSNFAHRAGYARFCPIVGIAIVGFADIDIVAFYCDSAAILRACVSVKPKVNAMS
jgi:hypothetical protein